MFHYSKAPVLVLGALLLSRFRIDAGKEPTAVVVSAQAFATGFSRRWNMVVQIWRDEQTK